MLEAVRSAERRLLKKLLENRKEKINRIAPFSVVVIIIIIIVVVVIIIIIIIIIKFGTLGKLTPYRR